MMNRVGNTIKMGSMKQLFSTNPWMAESYGKVCLAKIHVYCSYLLVVRFIQKLNVGEKKAWDGNLGQEGENEML